MGLASSVIPSPIKDMGTDELVAMAGDWLDEQYDKLTDEEIIFQAGENYPDLLEN